MYSTLNKTFEFSIYGLYKVLFGVTFLQDVDKGVAFFSLGRGKGIKMKSIAVIVSF